ncbi:MAG: hypothetical protein A2Z29_05315 [Chloroflexi bacterium RBG_16_56_11]|nr:MAG: hypothetical protein A2Z29_05315 [Chloroflexi bacterium RBG_16_56_11]
MKWQDLIIDGFGRVLELVEPALDGLSRAELDRQPNPDCNSIGWIVWHLTRGQDAQIADLMGGEQVWVKEKWYVKFKRAADPGDTGFGHGPEDVAAFKSPDTGVLMDYYRATLEQTKRYLSGLSLKDLDRELDEAYQPRPTVGVRIVSIMADCLQHSGEAAYLRGFLKGKGWLGY